MSKSATHLTTMSVRSGLVLLSLLLSACSMMSPARYGPIHEIDTVVEYVGPDNIPLDSSRYPGKVILAFPMVSGAIFGSPQDNAMFVSQLDDSLHFHIDLAEKPDMFEDAIAPLDETWKQAGLVIEPDDTRIGRLGTFPYGGDDGSQVGAGGFFDPVTRNTLILVYVDRACTISGEFSIGLTSYRHELVFNNRGFHWVRIAEPSHTIHVLQNHEGKDARFSIQILDLEMI